MNWEWFHRLGSPRWFYEKTTAWLPFIALSSIVLLVVGSVLGLGFLPAEKTQGDSYRIIYIHVPSSVVSMAGYLLMAVSGAIGLIWQIKLSFVVMRSAAIVGAALAFLSLLTGSVWGKPTWGTYWHWDARIIFTFILLLLYLGIIILHGAFTRKDTADKVCSILALVGVFNVPLIYYSVYLWDSLHQEATIKITEKSEIAASMGLTLLVMVVGFYLAYAWALILHVRAEILVRERKTKWVSDIISH